MHNILLIKYIELLSEPDVFRLVIKSLSNFIVPLTWLIIPMTQVAKNRPIIS